MYDKCEQPEYNLIKSVNAETFDNFLIDSYGRKVTYLRLAITDRCNLRCSYCMPETGVPYLNHNSISTFEELLVLAQIFADFGVTKIRLTGGEPFVRKGFIPFLYRLKNVKGISTLHITTNGVAAASHVDQLIDIGISGINLSLDTLNRKRFHEITRKDYFHKVFDTFEVLVNSDIPLKINSVVLNDTTDQEIIELFELARQFPIPIRFIEKMPFSGRSYLPSNYPDETLHSRITRLFPLLESVEPVGPTTARLYSLPKFKGNIGIIEGYSRKFCQVCNKLRITPEGVLKNCLYDNGVVNLKSMLRNNDSINDLKRVIVNAVRAKKVNGHSVQKENEQFDQPSMASIGG